MKAEDLYKLVRGGLRPVIEFNEGVYQWWEEAVDPLMKARVIDAQYKEGEIRFLLELREFEAFNRTVARFDWLDNNGEATLCWFDTSLYPDGGVEAFYLPPELDMSEVCEVKGHPDLYNEYVKTKTTSPYINWLEKQVLALRKETDKGSSGEPTERGH